MRKLSFSNKFPQGHAKQGQPTYFLEKINRAAITQTGYVNPIDYGDVELQEHQPKLLTIRSKPLIKGECYACYTQNGGRFTPHIDYGSLRIIDVIAIDIIDGIVFLEGNEIDKNDTLNLAILDGFENSEDFFSWHGNDTTGYINYWGCKYTAAAEIFFKEDSGIFFKRHLPTQYIPKRTPPIFIEGEWVLLDGQHSAQIVEIMPNLKISENGKIIEAGTQVVITCDEMIVSADRLWKDLRFQSPAEKGKEAKNEK